MRQGLWIAAHLLLSSAIFTLLDEPASLDNSALSQVLTCLTDALDSFMTNAPMCQDERDHPKAGSSEGEG